MPYVPVSAASSCSSAEAWSAKAEQKASGLTQDLIKAEQKRKLRAQLLFHERLADVEARLNDRNHPLELVDGGGDRGLFGFFLRLLTGERGEPGAVLCRSRSSLRFRLGPVRGG